MNIQNAPKTIKEARDLFVKGEYMPSDLLAHYIQNIESKNKDLNIYLEVFEDAMGSAKLADERYKAGTARELEGMPFAIKDCILIKGKTVSGGSLMLENYIAPYDATAIRLLREAGAIFIGRTNMDEFAMGGSGENSAYGPTKNPLDITRVPGGTSSGSAAALAGDMCLVALGSDTGGSVRQPGSFCGVYGFKPSYGGISRSGLMAAGSSLDQIGVLANSIEDIEIVYKIIGKEDVLDGTTIPGVARANKNDKSKDQNKFVKNILYPKSYIDSEGVNKEVRDNFYQFLDKAKEEGYEVTEVDLESLKYALAMYYIIMPAEVSTNLSRLEGLRFGGADKDDMEALGEIKDYQDLYRKNRSKYFGSEAKRRIIIGTYVLSHGYYDAYYGKATLMREKMKAEFAKIFESGSIFLTPTAPSTAFKLASEMSEPKSPLSLYLEDIFTVPANLAMIPGISIPSGTDSEGMPFGVQALSGFGHEEHIFSFVKDMTI
jgi:aspartyl-tRNA(Asn)/glutamyl-tRNA(Gln) amidotransferase subunit A